jgi:hypothetical protein
MRSTRARRVARADTNCVHVGEQMENKPGARHPSRGPRTVGEVGAQFPDESASLGREPGQLIMEIMRVPLRLGM